MEVIALQSGSSGNCIYVEAGGKQLLFDAGISGIQAETRLADHGRDIRDIDALIISHDHRDHAVGMGIYQRKYGLPIYVTRATLAVARPRRRCLALLFSLYGQPPGHREPLWLFHVWWFAIRWLVPPVAVAWSLQVWL